MSGPILTTKLYIPSPPPKAVYRPRLIHVMNNGLNGKLTLISAPAGSGKTTLLSEWIARSDRRIAWLSLDESDNDAVRFLTYLTAALQPLTPHSGGSILAALQSMQPPSVETTLTMLLNDIAKRSDNFVLVLDDYHVINDSSVQTALTFLLNQLPPQMHLVIATREEPVLPLSRLRARGQLTELRAIDLRFNSSEAADFLNQVMGLMLTEADVTALENRTEGWIAGLQLAALALQGATSQSGHPNVTSFIHSFTGSHRFVVDYLVEEVFQQQPEPTRHFLLGTCILDRLCGALCDAVMDHNAADGQATLEYLEHANLFIVPLDNQRRWYRYHHLFADLLRHRLYQSASSADVNELHRRASAWYEANGLELEAFQHATAGQDIERAERLIEGQGMPLLFRGAMAPVMNWLKSLPTAVLDARPSLWIWYAFASMSMGEATGIEQKLQVAETALQGVQPDEKIGDAPGRIAAIRAMLAIPQNDITTMIAQSQRALELLHPANLPVRTAGNWALGYAYHLRGDRAFASTAYMEVISSSEASGNLMFNIAATSSLATLQQADNQLHLAVETYQRTLQLAGDPPLPHASGAYIGLGQIFYEWNDLSAAYSHGERGLELGMQIESVALPASARVLLARVRLAQGDIEGAVAELEAAERFIRDRNFTVDLPELVAARVLVLIHQGDLTSAAELAHGFPISRAQVYLAQGNPLAALTLLEPVRQQAEERGWQDERLRVLVLQALALYANSQHPDAIETLREALTMAQSGNFVRTFVDEGLPMAHLLREAYGPGIKPGYIEQLLTAFIPSADKTVRRKKRPVSLSATAEALSERELEVLQYMAEGLTNQEIADLLHLSLNTIKVHSRNIYSKLGTHNRLQAVTTARAYGLLPSP